MKKTLLFFALAAAVAFTSCSKDDDDNKCDSCTAQGQKIEICDNGDGSYTISTNDGAETITEAELGGLTPKQVVDLTCEALNSLPDL